MSPTQPSAHHKEPASKLDADPGVHSPEHSYGSRGQHPPSSPEHPQSTVRDIMHPGSLSSEAWMETKATVRCVAGSGCTRWGKAGKPL